MVNRIRGKKDRVKEGREGCGREGRDGRIGVKKEGRH